MAHQHPFPSSLREEQLTNLQEECSQLRLKQRNLQLQLEALQQTNKELTEAFQSATQRLKKSLAQQLSIMDHIVDGILITNIEGRILQHNSAWRSIFSEQLEPLEQKEFQPMFGEQLESLWNRAKSSPGQIFSEHIALPNQRIGQAIVTAINHTDEFDGFFVQNWFGILCLVRDITREQEIDKMKTDFISTVSHELRTPLTSILGFAKIISKKLEKSILPLTDLSSPKAQRSVEHIFGNLEIISLEGERLTSLINDMLDVAKMEAGKLDWREETLTIQDILERSVKSVSSLLEPKKLKLFLEIEPELPSLKGDTHRLIQVVINLLSNAIKFTDHGTIRCRAQRKEQCIEVSVQDSGTGIAHADLQKVFDRFQQVGDVDTNKPKGTGLGLPISKQIVEYHKGHIWVESTLGQGSTFRFTLPLPSDS